MYAELLPALETFLAHVAENAFSMVASVVRFGLAWLPIMTTALAVIGVIVS